MNQKYAQAKEANSTGKAVGRRSDFLDRLFDDYKKPVQLSDSMQFLGYLDKGYIFKCPDPANPTKLEILGRMVGRFKENEEIDAKLDARRRGQGHQVVALFAQSMEMNLVYYVVDTKDKSYEGEISLKGKSRPIVFSNIRAQTPEVKKETPVPELEAKSN